jgi:hypothetical protein
MEKILKITGNLHTEAEQRFLQTDLHLILQDLLQKQI